LSGVSDYYPPKGSEVGLPIEIEFSGREFCELAREGCRGGGCLSGFGKRVEVSAFLKTDAGRARRSAPYLASTILDRSKNEMRPIRKGAS
jgi:hypothetical protein